MHSTNKSKGNIDKEIEEEIVTDNIKNDTVNKEEADKVTLVEFEESYKDLCENSCPYFLKCLEEKISYQHAYSMFFLEN